MSVRIWITLFVLLAGASQATGAVIAFWDFNLGSLAAAQGTGSITHNFVPASTTYVPGSAFGTPSGEPAGTALRIQKFQNNGRHMDFAFDATGFENIVLTFATRRDIWGFMANQVAVSSDGGTTYANYAPPFDPRDFWNVPYFDLSSFAALNDNAAVRVRFTFWGGTGPNPGLNDVDNVLFAGEALPAPEPSSLLACLGTLFLIARRAVR